MNKPYDIEQCCVITNGEPHESTIQTMTDEGFILLGIEKARKFHPYAMETDCISFFAKPIDKAVYDEWLSDFDKENKTAEGHAQ